MKRYITILVLLAAAGLGAAAQETSKVDLTFGWGGYPIMEQLLYGNGFMKYDTEIDPVGMAQIYRVNEGKMRSTGTMTLTVDVPVKKWFSVPFMVAGNVVWQNCRPVDGTAPYAVVNGTVQVLAGARFKWINRPKVNLYASLNVGLGLATDSYTSQINDEPVKVRHMADPIPAFQVVPLGVRFGGKLYGIAEIGAGTLYCGGMVGIGYKF